jgi:hypothetical protein
MTAIHNAPSWAPLGFKLQHRFTGEAAGGFHGAGNEQVAFVHSRIGRDDEHNFPLMVFVTAAKGRELDGTNGHAGTEISLGLPGATAIYHDGMWYVDGAALHEVGLEKSKHWRTDLVHSITVHAGDRTVAVRAKRDVELKDMVQIVRSLDLA